MGVEGGERVVVVGNGMTSQSFCRHMSDNRDRNKYTISVFGEEPRPAYDRVRLTEYFDGRSPASLELASREWYAERNIGLHTGCRIQSIDRSAKKVLTSTGESYAYDKLVLATGSRPFVPPIKGVDLEGVFVYRTIQDVKSIEKFGQSVRTAAVMGGGLLGLEAAKALRDMNLNTHVVEMAPGLMPRQLNRESAEELKRRVERMGVQVHVTRRTLGIERHGEFLVIRFDTGDSVSVDMVVISAGIRPCDELGRDSGLDIGPRGGIQIDDYLQSSDPNIFAIGECACHRETVYGLVGPCYQMAKDLADCLYGAEVGFVEADQSAKLKLMGVDVATFGEPIGQAAGADVVSANIEGATRTLLIRDRQLVGALGVGKWPEADAVRVAISELQRPSGWQLRRFRKTGNLFAESMTRDVSSWPPNALICSCMGVKRSELTTACQQGASSIEELAACTGASTVCGSCRPLLASMVGTAEKAVAAIARSRELLLASLAAVILVAGFSIVGPVPTADSVTGFGRQLDLFWRDEFWKQVTGFSLLGVTVLSLLFSLRKRVKRIQFGAFGTWRMAHAILGVTTLIGLLSHTGWRWGANLNFWLMTCFVGINLVGGFTGLVSSLETRVSAGGAVMLRLWRPRLTLLHIVLFWPLPLLIAVHVFSFYYY